MTDIPIEIPVQTPGATEATEQIDKLTESIEGLSEKVEENTEATEENAEALESGGIALNAYAEIAMKGIEIAGKTYEALKKLYDEYNRQAVVIRNLAGPIDEASDRLNGFISIIDLMETRNKLAAGGLQLTEHQFANLSVAAQRFSSESGEDVNQVLNQMGEALRDGTGKLNEFGLSTNGATDASQAQANALESLETQYGETEAAGFSLNNMLEDSKTLFVEALVKTGSLDESLSQMSQTITHLAETFGLLNTEGNNSLTWTGFLEHQALTLEIAVESLNVQLKRASDILQGIATANYGQVFSTIIEALPDPSGVVQANQNVRGRRSAGSQSGRAALGALNPVAQTPTRSSGGGSPRESLASIAQRASDEAELNTQVETRNELLAIEADRLARIAQEEQLRAEFNRTEEERLKTESDQREEREQLAHEAQLARLEELANAREAAEQEHQKILEQNAAYAKETTMTTGKLAIGSIQAVINAEGNKKKALKEYFLQWSKQFAMEQTFAGLAATAEGIGLSITNPPASGTKFAEAGARFALAGLVGGAAAGASSGKGGGGGGKEKPSTSPGNASNNNNSSGPITNVVNVSGMIFPNAAQVGRAVEEVLDAKRTRY